MCKLYSSLFALLLTFGASTPSVDGANILALLPSPSPSHLIVEMAVVHALIDHHHNVTVVSTLPIKPSVLSRNLTFIQLNSGFTSMEETVKNLSKAKGLSKFLAIVTSMQKLSNGVAKILDDPGFKQFLNNKDNKFDLLLHGYIFSEYLFGVAYHFNCPSVLIWPNQLMPHVMALIGNTLETAYVPLPFINNLTSDSSANFLFRLINILRTAFDMATSLVLEYNMKGIYDKHFPADRYPDFETAKKNVSLILYCHHFTEKPVRALVPGLVEIGGIQLDEEPNELPQDIAKFLDDAEEHGAIYFSLGTNVRAEHLRPNTLKTIYNVLSKLPQKVIWKCDSFNDLPGNASNIMPKIWAPQADILAHPNIRLFFSHGGKGGITEAQFYGVPMVMMPVFGDQSMNSLEVVRKGYGVEIENLQKMTEADVQKAVDEVLNNSKYSQTVKRFSKLYRDRPMTPKQTAVYWIEYVIRNGGALHMQSPLKHLNFIEKHNLDVILFFIVILYVILKGMKISCKLIWTKLRRKPQNKVKTN